VSLVQDDLKFDADTAGMVWQFVRWRTDRLLMNN
jgi:hypothetical protein